MNRVITQRNEYKLSVINRKSLSGDPLKQFSRWYNAAEKIKIHTPNAAVLSTASKSGKPSARVILIKAFNQRGFEFFTHYRSDKAGDLAVNPKAELVFYWPVMERQVRIFGAVKKMTRSESLDYFLSRPRGAQIAAWTSAQSRPIDSRQKLLQIKKQTEKKFLNSNIPLPPDWGGYRLQPKSFEFWQGRPDRVNDRYLYRKKAGQQVWTITCLQP